MTDQPKAEPEYGLPISPRPVALPVPEPTPPPPRYAELLRSLL